jgi:hypothetical protein
MISGGHPCLLAKAIPSEQLAENHHPWLRSAKFIEFSGPAVAVGFSLTENKRVAAHLYLAVWHGSCLYSGSSIPVSTH